MDGQLVWKDEYNIGVDIIDQEHKRLFKIINKLFRFSDEESVGVPGRNQVFQGSCGKAFCRGRRLYGVY